MKSLKYLLPILLLTACVGTQEVYDDVYYVVPKQDVSQANDELGYEDYIDGNEADYEVEVLDQNPNSSASAYTSTGTYNSQGGNITVNNYNESNAPNNAGNYCSYNCNDYMRYSRCRHNGSSYYHANFTGHGYTFFGYSSMWGGNYDAWGNYRPYRPYDFYGHYYNPYGMYGSYNPYAYRGAFYYGRYYNYNGYGAPYIYDNPYYGGYPYYGGNPYYNGNPYYGGGSTSGGGNSPGNNYYGHRNGMSTGSSNTTSYAHTVETPAEKKKPFKVYSSGNGLANVIAQDKNEIQVKSNSLGNVNGLQGTHDNVISKAVPLNKKTDFNGNSIQNKQVENNYKAKGVQTNSGKVGVNKVAGNTGHTTNGLNNNINKSGTNTLKAEKTYVQPASDKFKVGNQTATYKSNSSNKNSLGTSQTQGNKSGLTKSTTNKYLSTSGPKSVPSGSSTYRGTQNQNSNINKDRNKQVRTTRTEPTRTQPVRTQPTQTKQSTGSYGTRSSPSRSSGGSTRSGSSSRTAPSGRR